MASIFVPNSADSEVDDGVWDGLVQLGLLMVEDIQSSMRETPRRSAARGEKHVPSMPGNPPAPDTGNLIGSVTLDDSNRAGAVVRVGIFSKAPYAVYLEQGTTKMAARPFLVPAAERAGELVDEAFEQVEI